MDAQQRIAHDCDRSVAVLGKGEDFVLVPLDGPLDAALTKRAEERGFCFCGVMGLEDGLPVAKCEPGPDTAVTMMHAALVFAQQVKGPDVDWLERLWQLPDPRNS